MSCFSFDGISIVSLNLTVSCFPYQLLPQTMASPFHDPSDTTISLVEHISALSPVHEGNSLSMDVHSLYTFPAYPWVPFDPTLVWPCLPAQFDPRLLTSPTANNPLATYETTLTNYLHAGSPSFMINLGHTGTQGPRVEDTSAAPGAINSSSGHIMEAIVDKHAIPQKQTACEAQKTMTK